MIDRPSSTTNRWLVALALTLGLIATACGDTTSDAAGDAVDDGADDTGEAATGDTTAPPSTGAEDQEDEVDEPVSGEAERDGEDAPATEPWDSQNLSLVPIASMSEPIALTSRPGSDDLWVLERQGRVRLIERTADGNSEQVRLRSEPVLDISDRVTTEGEGGLLGLAFSADGNQLYLNYTDRDGATVVSEVAMGATTADAGSERVLLRVEQPYSNHNGGHLAFGPDGYLYVGLGDGGSADDPHGHGQDTSTLLGSLLRIDPAPSASADYTIPDGNPLSGGSDRPEIWLWGVRNPWRFSFDAATGDLWISDVGQNEIEEIDYLPATDQGPGRGANLGWNLMEGNEPFAGDPPPDHTGPIHTYTHDEGRCSVTGGYSYRGSATSSLDGVYLFADFCTGEVFGLERSDGEAAKVARLNLDRQPSNVVSFGEGPDGELYVLEQGGAVSRLQAADSPLETTIVADS